MFFALAFCATALALRSGHGDTGDTETEDGADMEPWEEFLGQAEGSWCTKIREYKHKYKEIHSRLQTGRCVSKILTHKFHRSACDFCGVKQCLRGLTW